jgi:6-phosphogluconolactonase
MKLVLRSTLAVAALVALLGSSVTAANAARVYIGTYTVDPSAPLPTGHGEGIYLADVDPATGALSHVKLAAKSLSPTWLTLSDDHRVLYAVNEIASFGADKSGTVSSYAVSADGSLKLLNIVSSSGSIPCFISIDPSKKFAMVANYTGGSYSVIRLKADGSLGETTDVVKPGGPLSVYNATDKPPGMFGDLKPHGSRGHMIAPDPSGRYVIGADAGRDQIFVWTLDASTGKLTQISNTKVAPGSAPRHFVFSPDGKTMYQLFEQTSRLAVFDFKDGKLSQKGGSVSALPNGYAGSNTGSELRMSKDGKHLYFANRLQDTIAIFTVGADGGVTRIANVHTEGDTPRSLTFDPSGKFIYSMNQNADNITAFSIGADGIPKFTGRYLPLGSPAAMAFLP